MKILFCSLFIFLSLHLYASYEDLPWIKAQDHEAINYAEPFLPKDPIIIEAGVCDAEDTLRMKERWPASIIYGFEPLPEFFKRSSLRTKHLKGVFLHNFALFDKVGKATFYRSRKMPGASSLLEDNLDNIEVPEDLDHDGINYQDEPITVNCTTIDHWAKEKNVARIDYIWLDTEGAELPILKNALTILPTVRVISIEVNFKEFRHDMTQFPDLYKFLTEQGFTLKYIWGRPDWQAVAVFVNSVLL